MVQNFIVLRTEKDKRSAYIKWRPVDNAYAYNIYYGTRPTNCILPSWCTTWMNTGWRPWTRTRHIIFPLRPSTKMDCQKEPRLSKPIKLKRWIEAQDRHTIFDLTVPACIRTCTGNTVYTGDLCFQTGRQCQQPAPECHPVCWKFIIQVMEKQFRKIFRDIPSLTAVSVDLHCRMSLLCQGYHLSVSGQAGRYLLRGKRLAASDTVTAEMVVDRFKTLYRLIRQQMPVVPVVLYPSNPVPAGKAVAQSNGRQWRHKEIPAPQKNNPLRGCFSFNDRQER